MTVQNEHDDQKENHYKRSQLSDETLKSVGEHYISFLQRSGQSDISPTQDDIAEIFAPFCTRIINGTVLCNSSDQYLAQIIDERKDEGKWIIQETLWYIASPVDGACSLQFIWEGEKMGMHTTMATLFLDDTGKIFKFHEVYNQYNPQVLSIQEGI